jgi:GNAT superfamily N-acetyltransferase
MLANSHELDDGTRVRLRLTRPSDAVRAFLDELSDDSWTERFTFYDPRERLVLAATRLEAGRERVVGLAEATFVATGTVDIAAVVGEESQGRGVGKLLSEAVASIALQRGASRLRAAMDEDNVPMLRLLERLGRTIRAVEDGRTVAYTRLDRSRRRSAA